MTARLSEVTMNRKAAIVVALDKTVAGPARAKHRLRTHSPESSRQISRFPTLQKNHNDEKQADQDVQGC